MVGQPAVTPFGSLFTDPERMLEISAHIVGEQTRTHTYPPGAAIVRPQVQLRTSDVPDAHPPLHFRAHEGSHVAVG